MRDNQQLSLDSKSMKKKDLEALPSVYASEVSTPYEALFDSQQSLD